jgi:hypothetical protein
MEPFSSSQVDFFRELQELCKKHNVSMKSNSIELSMNDFKRTFNLFEISPSYYQASFEEKQKSAYEKNLDFIFGRQPKE